MKVVFILFIHVCEAGSEFIVVCVVAKVVLTQQLSWKPRLYFAGLWDFSLS